MVQEAKIKVIEPSQAPDIDARKVGNALRKWNHTSSLAGLLMTTDHCTYGNPAHILQALEPQEPDYVLVLPGHHGFPTSQAIKIILEQGFTDGWGLGFYIAEGPRGLSPIIWKVSSLKEVLANNLLAQSAFWGRWHYWVKTTASMPSRVTRCRRDFDLRTRRGRAFCSEVASALHARKKMPAYHPENHTPLPLEDIIEAANSCFQAWVGDTPRDIEIEITTQRPLEPSYLPKINRPNLHMELAHFERFIAQCKQDNDSINLTLGGFGDPLEHPEVLDFIRSARPHVQGLNIRSFCFEMDEQKFAALQEAGIDVLTWRFGYWGKEAHQKAHGVDDFERLQETLRSIRTQQLHEAEDALPIICPEVVKGIIGDKSLLDFWEYCLSLLLWPSLLSYNTFCGELPSQQAIPLYPSTRSTCLKISEQLIVCANGEVPMCWQDFNAKNSLGNIKEHSLQELWHSPKLTALRNAHEQKQWDRESALCQKCNEWFRLS